MAIDSDTYVAMTTSAYACFDDPLFLSNNESTSLSLVSTKFDGTKFLSWKREAYLTLIVKNKDGFVDGTCKMPPISDSKHHQWKICDYMVLKWISNSLTPEIKETVDYTTSAREIWSDLLERYSQMNSVEIYQLLKELSGISQENLLVVEYYSKLKRTWETLDSVDPIPMCTCGVMATCACQLLKRLFVRETQTKLIQFLMGLNGGYETVKTHVLSMEPLPPLNKADALLQQVEKQKQVVDAVDVLAEANAYASARQADSRQGHFKKAKPENDSSEDTLKICSNCKKQGHLVENCHRLMTCTHCDKKGHIRDYCFDLRKSGAGSGTGQFGNAQFSHNQAKGKRVAGSYIPSNTYFQNGRNVYRRAAYNADTVQDEYSPLDSSDEGLQQSASDAVPHADFLSSSQTGASPSTSSIDPVLVQGIVQSVYQQVMKSLPGHSANVALNFAGILPSSHVNTVHSHSNIHSWIIDTGASDHMISHECFLFDIKLLQYPIHIGLPDGTVKIVHKAGKLRLTAQLLLHNVLIVPDFKVNLLFVGKLLETANLVVHFTENACYFQDLSSKVNCVVAKKIGGLYRLHMSPEFFWQHKNWHTADVASSFSYTANKTSVELFHARLGHTSKDKLSHVTAFHNTSKKDFFCDTCAMAKHHMLPFSRSLSHASHCFNLVHMDLWGPYRALSLNGAK
ncbi:uncharacterized protein LOC141633426 [Silene latifolia]|uniref:uncharacterized protein LOC141633426 n=1 Tax=Silene latifolia TaxID=37657 RepID=UPI003D779E01